MVLDLLDLRGFFVGFLKPSGPLCSEIISSKPSLPTDTKLEFAELLGVSRSFSLSTKDYPLAKSSRSPSLGIIKLRQLLDTSRSGLPNPDFKVGLLCILLEVRHLEPLGPWLRPDDS